jgi:hypothetical protein
MRTRPPLLSATTLFASSLFTLGCHVSLDREQGTIPLSFKVEIQEPVGTPEAPLEYSTAPRTFTLDVQAIELNGEPADWFEGEVHLDVAPRGRLAKGQQRTITLVKGKATGVTVQIQRVHGDSSIWVEDRGTDEKPGSYATGLSPTIYTSHPTLHDVSETTNIAGSALDGDFVQVNTKGRRLVATGLAVDGFYVTDLDDPTQSYNAIFAHTHSRPRGVQTGDLITEIIGTVEEFYGFTELGFPTYKVGGRLDEIPTFVLTPEVVADDQEMEKLESRLVEVRDVTVCELGEGYSSFGQWVVLLDPAGNCISGDGGITIVSALSATKFTPAPLVGKVLPRIVGDLRYHVAANPPWIMYTRSDADIETE